MHKTHKRAIRRRKYRLLLKKKRHYNTAGNGSEKHIAKMVNNPTMRDCQCCKNPRRSLLYKGKSKLTLQERKLDDVDYLLNEYNEEVRINIEEEERKIREYMEDYYQNIAFYEDDYFFKCEHNE